MIKFVSNHNSPLIALAISSLFFMAGAMGAEGHSASSEQGINSNSGQLISLKGADPCKMEKGVVRLPTDADTAFFKSGPRLVSFYVDLPASSKRGPITFAFDSSTGAKAWAPGGGLVQEGQPILLTKVDGDWVAFTRAPNDCKKG